MITMIRQGGGFVESFHLYSNILEAVSARSYAVAWFSRHKFMLIELPISLVRLSVHCLHVEPISHFSSDLEQTPEPKDYIKSVLDIFCV